MRVIRSAYDCSRVVVGLACLAAEDRTQQSFKDECDINVLMKRFERTGVLPVGRELPPQYADVTSVDFESSMQRIAAVSGAFSMLDARTRARFENDPARMLDFLADPANNAEAVKLGLMVQPKESRDGSSEAVARVEGAGRAGSENQAGSAAGREAAGAGEGAARGSAAGEAGGEAGRGGKAAVGHSGT